ncbi:benenodin family lasso peptide [Sphingomonas sp. URHD0057]|nr:benenodin family lasso peptide [Sphingomonas sp. URHD0057]
MNRKHEHDELIDLGTASAETKGGPWGIDDHRASLMTNEGGLTLD